MFISVWVICCCNNPSSLSCSYSKTNKMHPFLKLFILAKHSTCFGRSFRPSSGVQATGLCQTYMVLSSISSPLAAGSRTCLTCACCWMYSVYFLMMDGKTVRNLQCFARNVNNCPTRCDLVQFLFPANCSTRFGWHLQQSSGARVNCSYSIWHWSNRMLPSAVVEESGLFCKNKWFEKPVYLVGFTTGIYYDARTYERQISLSCSS
jgi:hypothetical protein